MSDPPDDLEALSLWEGPDDAATRIDSFRYVEDSDGRYVRISLKTWADADLPQDVEGWPVTLTVDGEHINASVVEHDTRAACHKLRLASDGPAIVKQLP